MKNTTYASAAGMKCRGEVFSKGWKMRLSGWLARSTEIMPTICPTPQARWQEELQGSVDAYARAENLPQPRLKEVPAPPRMLGHEDVPAFRAYAYEISKFSWHGAWTGALTGTAVGVYLGCTMAPGMVLASALGMALVGAGAGYHLIGYLAQAVCGAHKRMLDRRAENLVARTYNALYGGTQPTIQRAIKSLNAAKMRSLARSEGRQALFGRAVKQLSEVSQALALEHESAGQQIRQAARQKMQQAANCVISDAIAGSMMDGPTYARQQVQACAKMFPFNDEISASLRHYVEEMESAVTAREFIDVASAYLAKNANDEAYTHVVRGLKYWRDSHPLFASTEGGRRMIDDKIETLLEVPRHIAGLTHVANKKSAQLLLQSAPNVSMQVRHAVPAPVEYQGQAS